MRQETLSIVLSGVAAATGVVAIYLSVRHNRQRSREREEDRRLLEEQLALARDQAEMRPNLRVVEVLLVDPDDSDAMEGSVDPPWIVKLRNLREVSPLSMVSTFLQQGRLYEELVEEKVVVVTLANEGKTAANLVTGWVQPQAFLARGTTPPSKSPVPGRAGLLKRSSGPLL